MNHPMLLDIQRVASLVCMKTNKERPRNQRTNRKGNKMKKSLELFKKMVCTLCNKKISRHSNFALSAHGEMHVRRGEAEKNTRRLSNGGNANEYTIKIRREERT